MNLDSDTLFVLARFHALRAGLTEETAQDCAVEFLERLLEQHQGVLEYPARFSHTDAWLHHSAANFAKNYLRAESRIHRREISYSILTDEEEEWLECLVADSAPTPESTLLQNEFWKRMNHALEQLSSDQCSLFLRHHLNGESIQELAASTQRTPHAVEQALLRARRRLRKILERQGITLSELSEHLSPPPPPIR